MPNIDLRSHPQIFIDRPQTIWVCVPKPLSPTPLPIDAFATEEQARERYRNQRSQLHAPEKATLHRQSLQPIYGGPTLLEALWAEMDRLMAGLMTGNTADDECRQKGYHGVPAPYDDFQAPCEHWENGDRYRAEELAWVIAIVTNAYAPSVNAVRAEAIQRWNEEVDQDDMNTRPEGADQ